MQKLPKLEKTLSLKSFVQHRNFKVVQFSDNMKTLRNKNLYKSAKVKDNNYHHSRSKSQSEKLYQKPRSSKIQSFNNFPEIIDRPDTDTLHDSPTSFTNQSNSSVHFKQSQISNRNTRTKYDLRPLPWKKHCLFIPSPSSPEK